MSISSFLDMARDRWSCRSFSTEPVPRDAIERLLVAAAAAPTGCNYQPFHLWAITGDEGVATVRANSRCHFGAPAFIVVGTRPDEAWTRPYDGFNVGVVDGSIVATHIMLEAWELGLGTCWVAHFDAPSFKQAFPQMEPYELIALFPIGYPADDAAPLPLHNTRKGIDELADWL